MKKVDLIHVTILIIALLCGYSALQSLIYFFETFFLGGDLYHLQGLSISLYELLNVGVLAAACAILIKNGRRYAAALLRNEPEASWETPAEWQLNRSNILLVLFIGMGLYTLIQAVPYAIQDLFKQFTYKISSDLYKTDPGGKTSLLVELLRVTIGAFLIYAAPTLTNFIERTIAVRLDSGSQSTT